MALSRSKQRGGGGHRGGEKRAWSRRLISATRLSGGPLLWTQCAAYVPILAGTRLGVGSLVFVGLALDGLSFALLERESETRYLQGLKGLPNRSTALQLLNGAYRLTTAAGEQVAGRAPLMLSLWLAPHTAAPAPRGDGLTSF